MHQSEPDTGIASQVWLDMQILHQCSRTTLKACANLRYPNMNCRCGPMVDLCHGPHLPNTGYLKSSAVGAVNRAFWRADVKREPLQVSIWAHNHKS